MSNSQLQFPVSRIVVTLESSCENVKALEIAVTMAARIKTALHGIFVEDLGLLRAASFPFVRHVGPQPGSLRSLEAADIEAEFRALAARARASLANLASQANVPWSFEVLRGERSSVVAATKEMDLLVMETMTRPFAPHMRLRTDWSDIALDCARACLLLDGSVGNEASVLVVYDGTEDGERAIAAGIALDPTPGAVLRIAAVAGESGQPDVPRMLNAAGVTAEIYRLGRLDARNLSQAIAETKSGLVIVPVALAVSHRSDLQPLLTAPPCAVLLVK